MPLRVTINSVLHHLGLKFTEPYSTKGWNFLPLITPFRVQFWDAVMSMGTKKYVEWTPPGSALPSIPIYHQFTAHVPPFSILRKFLHFQPCFVQNFSSQDENFPNFHSQDPSFFKENPLPRPYFWKPVWHTPTNKKSSASPPSIAPHPLWRLEKVCKTLTFFSEIYDVVWFVIRFGRFRRINWITSIHSRWRHQLS